jgi:hypothetical protein
MRIVIACLLLACVTFVVYSPSFRFDFINYDDQRVLLDHPELYNQARFTDSVKAIVFDCYPREEPLIVRDTSWAIDSKLFGFRNPAGYHYMNVALHSLVVVMLFIFLTLTTRRPGFSFATTLFFVTLAVHVEPVVWVMGRKDILASLFALLALIAQCKMLVAGKMTQRCVWYLLSLFCFVLALMSKISLFFLPPVLFLHMILFRHLRSETPPDSACTWRFAFTRALPLVLPHCIITVLIVRWYFGVLSQYGFFDRGYSAGLLRHIWNLAMINPLVIAKYIGLIFIPHNLSMFYTWPDLCSQYSGLQITMSSLLIIAFLAIGVWLWLCRKDLAFYYLTFFMLMLPYLNVKYVGIWMANRYVYLSSFCVSAFAVSVVFPLEGRSRTQKIMGIALLIACGVFNLAAKYEYQTVWRNGETLWSYEISLPSTRIYAYDNLATFCYARGMAGQVPAERNQYLARIDSIVEQAESRYWINRKLAPPPQFYSLYFVKALVSQVRGEPLDSQLRALKRAEELNPRNPAALFELAVFYYRRALESAPESKEKLARTSLDYFKRYARFALKDRGTMKKISDMRAMYIGDFPSMSAGVEMD